VDPAYRFARVSPPTTDEEAVPEITKLREMINRKSVKDLPMRSLDKLGVLEGAPRKLRERVTECRDALRLHFEATLL
jgi:hypothetical protein